MRITAKPHAHFPTMTKIAAKFQNDLGITVGGVAFIRSLVSIGFGRS